MKKLKILAALISSSFQAAYAVNNLQINQLNANVDDGDNTINASILNKSVPQYLAAHRSHSSHSSHRSHRSSSGSSYSSGSSSSSQSYSAPSTPSHSYDPLGQERRSSKSYPSTNNAKTTTQDKEKLKNTIMRVQLALQFKGLYTGNIDGIMGPKTRSAIEQFKKQNNIQSSTLLDAKTLNAMGISAY